jgi:multidrug efflux pump subunit AcrA (membrane-fusion protein)
VAEAGAVEGQPAPLIVPYSAIVYVAQGDAFVYTNPAPRTFLRQPVEVDYIEGNEVVLKAGPAPGTQVAVVGVTELFGTEFGVGH